VDTAKACRGVAIDGKAVRCASVADGDDGDVGDDDIRCGGEGTAFDTDMDGPDCSSAVTESLVFGEAGLDAPSSVGLRCCT